jgi:hypothetical protein
MSAFPGTPQAPCLHVQLLYCIQDVTIQHWHRRLYALNSTYGLYTCLQLFSFAILLSRQVCLVKSLGFFCTLQLPKMADPVCSSCHETLWLEVEPDSEGESNSKAPATNETIPDDVELQCGCHYHWECFLDAYNITQCPNCSKEISSLSSTGQQQVLCTVRNEGGIQENFDILPSATEEAYLRAYPEERRGHAYLEFCREGDIDAIIHMVKDATEDDPDSEDDADEHQVQPDTDILSYTGTFEGIEGSGLHVAIRYGREDVAWLLLCLASSLDWARFPSQVLGAMEGLGLSKQDRVPGVEIRSIKDAEGRSPESLAQELGGTWKAWVESGRLTV